VNVTRRTAFSSNVAEVDGGGIFIIGEATAAVDGGATFYNNSAHYAGADIHASADRSLVMGAANISSKSPSVSW
jgi:hypothetical protein